MAFAVVVDVPAVEAAAAARTLATCNAALGAGKCALADVPRDSSEPVSWYAVVRYGPQGQAKLTIELYRGSPGGTPVAKSELEFKLRDAPEERWASVGVVVAGLVLAQPESPSAVDRQSEPLPSLPTQATPARPLSGPAPSPWLRLDLGATAGSEVRSAPLRVGPFARLGIAFASIPVCAFVSGAYTVRSSGSTDLSWWTGSLGAGVHVGFARQQAALDLRGELLLETLGIRATDEDRSESARRTRAGARLGLDLSGYFLKNWALVLGGEVGALGPRVVIDVVATGQTEELPPFVWGLLSAIRHDFR